MNRLLLTAALIATLSGTLLAAPLTPEQALNAFQNSGTRKLVPGANPELVYTAQTVTREPAVYVFNNRAGGFMLLAADDEFEPLVGYSTEGEFDPAKMSPAQQWWMSQYAAQVQQARLLGVQSRADDFSAPAINPLCSTLWSQDSPYNKMCPVIGYMPAPVGCVATAAAQIMKYHQFPARGQGSNSYSWYSSDGKRHTLKTDFSQSEYKWEQMLNSYKGDHYTEAQADAVALLSANCGAAANMAYDTYASGTTSTPMAYGLVTYFNYDKSLAIAQRACYEMEAWNELIYNELKAKRPVLYTGSGQGGGHAFVCDGFDGNGYFHFNWGWAGMSDGYYKLSLLDPPAMGTGGGLGGGFNGYQEVYINMEPDHGTLEVTPQIYLLNNFTSDRDTYNRNSSTSLTFGETSEKVYMNYCPAILTNLTPGLKLVSGDKVQYVAAGKTLSQVKYDSGYANFSIVSSDIPTGTWTVTPAYKLGGKWYDVTTVLNSTRKLTMRVTDTKITVSGNQSATNFNLRFSNFAYPEHYYAGKDFLITADFKNLGPQYYGTLMLLAQDSRNQYLGPQATVVWDKGQEGKISWVGNFTDPSTGAAAQPGNYTVFLITDLFTIMAEPFEITIEAAPGGTATITVPQLVAANATGSGTSKDPYVIDLTQAKFNATVKCNRGYFSGNIGAEILPYPIVSADDILGFMGTQYIMLNAGESKDIVFEGDLSYLEAGKKYALRPENTTKTVIFTSKESGIETLGDGDNEPVRYYDLSGREVLNPTHGIFIVRQGSRVSKIAL